MYHTIKRRCRIFCTRKFLLLIVVGELCMMGILWNTKQQNWSKSKGKSQIRGTEGSPTKELHVYNVSMELLGITEDDLTDSAVLNISTNEIFHITYIKYLKQLRNPCFVVPTEGQLRFYCLPYFYVIGFPRCGTSSLYHLLRFHYNVARSNGKEAHFWDNLRRIKKGHQLNLISLYGTIYASTLWRPLNDQCFNPQPQSNNKSCSAIAGDFTPRTIFDAEDWQNDPSNEGLAQPRILTPHKIQHLMQWSHNSIKLIVLMRNPADALFSFYTYTFGSHGSTYHFHKLVSAALAWWKQCLHLLPLRNCAYSIDFPIELQQHVRNLGYDELSKFNTGRRMLWQRGSATLVRSFIYDIYIEDWLRVFPIEQFLFLEFTDFINNPVGYVNDMVLPFLELEKFSEPDMDFIANGNWTTNKSANVNYTMDTMTRLLLNRLYAPFNRQLAQRLNNSKFLWQSDL